MADGGGGAGTGGGGTGAARTGGVDGNSANDGGTIPPDLRVRLDAANSAWAAAKTGCATYSYDRRWRSAFPTEPLRSTEVEVMADRPTRRRYSTGATVWADGGTELRWTTVWDETGTEVGSHAPGGSPAIFPASTVEQLLAECATVLAGDPAMYMVEAVFDPQYGVPTQCTQRLMGCADDCTLGIQIDRFACAPLPAR